MKRFDFPLERVRQWRQNQVEMEEMRLQQLYAELRATEAERAEITAEAERSCYAVLSKSSVFAEELSLLARWREYADAQVKRLRARERELEARIVEQRQRLLESNRRFRLLEGLRDKSLVSWKAARDKELEDLAAELFLAGHVRASMNRRDEP